MEHITIPLEQSGFTHNPNTDLVPGYMFVEPTRNVETYNGFVEPRRGSAKVNTVAITAAPKGMGGFDFRTNAGTQYIVTAWKSGKVYKDSTNTIIAGMSTSNYFSFETFDVSGTNKLFIADGAVKPQVWDGSSPTTADITSVASDWTGSNFPQQLVRRQQGFSSTMIAIGFSTTKKNFWVSKADDANDFSDANSTKMKCDTGDGYGPVSGMEVGDRFFIAGKSRMFYLDDSSATRTDWQLVPAPFIGGVAHFRLWCRADNNVYAMSEDMVFYQVETATEYGDYRKANLMKAAFMDRWVRENVDASYIADFHMNFDPVSRAIFIWVVRRGKTTANTALVYYVDRDPATAWQIHEAPNTASGYAAASSFLVRYAAGDYRLYTQDASGFIWRLGETTRSDDGNGYYSGFKLAPNTFGKDGAVKHIPRLFVVAKPSGTATLNINWSVDGANKAPTSVDLTSSVAKFGTAKFGRSKFGSSSLLDRVAELGDKGKRWAFEFYMNTAGKRFQISSVRADVDYLTEQPQ